MTARCASCSYPLTVSDSVSCYECSSHFHIDCAQLVGFPYFELSSDPCRNTFHCATCKLLPLPKRQSDSDSDSDWECAMPSRQLDYRIEGQPDFAVDMNEIKGSVQDLSDLCKDMLREINDIKSINLTLRCCVENLRHENEARDRMVEELKRRLDALERNSQRKTGVHWDVDEPRPEEDVERYMTPEPPATAKEDDIELSLPKHITFDNSYKIEVSKTLEILSDSNSSQEETKTENEEKEHKFLDSKEEETSKEYHPITNISQKTELEPSIETKPEDLKEAEENRQDWTWKGDKAIALDSPEEDTDEGNVEEESEMEDVDAQEWELLNEEIQSETAARRFVEDATASAAAAGDDWNEGKGEEDLGAMEREKERGRTQTHERSKRHVEEEEWGLHGDDDYDKDEEDKKTEDYLEDDETEDETEIEADNIFQEDKPEIDTENEVEQIPEDGKEVGETPLAEEDADKVSEETEAEGEILNEGAVLTEGEPHSEGEQLEGEPKTEDELHLEDERPTDEEGQPVVEGEESAGGQSPEEGEVQPAEPPPPPEPQHTEEDLWHYLKEAVTSVHPSTVEEFVQNLIGTLQHVPDEYLRPVIDANIKRATSPSVTDGEHLPVESHLEGEEGVPVEGSPPSDSLPGAEGDITLSAEDHSAPILDDTPSAEEEPAAPTEELSSDIPEDHGVDEDYADPDEGYSALEATA